MSQDLFRGLQRGRNGAILLNADGAVVARADAPGASDPFTRGLARDVNGALLVELSLAGAPVTITNPQNRDVLMYDSTARAWVNRPVA